ncbi:hypothetical protein, partial [Mycobacterium timonense]
SQRGAGERADKPAYQQHLLAKPKRASSLDIKRISRRTRSKERWMTNENAKAISSATRRQTFGHNNVDWPVNVLAITPEEDPVMQTSSPSAVPADYTANTDTVPVGLNGSQRERYLGLDRTQRRIYRYHYDVCGRLASHCYKLAVGENLWPAVPNERRNDDGSDR